MSNDQNYTDIEEQSEEGQDPLSVRESISGAESPQHMRKNNVNKNRRTKNTCSLIAGGEPPLTNICSKNNHKNKDLQNVRVELLEDISVQIRSSQKALAHHRRDFNHHRQDINLRLSNMENLLGWIISKMELIKIKKIFLKQEAQPKLKL